MPIVEIKVLNYSQISQLNVLSENFDQNSNVWDKTYKINSNEFYKYIGIGLVSNTKIDG